MIKLLKYLNKKNWILFLISVCFIVLQVYLNLKLPDYMSTITELAEEGGSTSQIWLNGSYMLYCALGSLVSAIIVGYFVAVIAADFAQSLRLELFNKVDSFSMAEINKFSTASLITRSTNDVTQIQNFLVIGLQLLIRSPITAVWAIIKIYNKGIEWSIATLIALIALSLGIIFVFIFVVPKFRKMQILTDNVNSATRENLQGVRVVRAYNAEEFQREKFEKTNKELTDNTLFTSRSMALFTPYITVIMSLLTLSIYWIGAYLIDAASLTDKLSIFSNMVVFSSYAMQVFMAFMMLIMVFVLLPRALAAANRMKEVLNTKPTIIEGDFDGNTEVNGEIEFNNVNFRYSENSENVLSNISFKAKKGQTIAFIGSTGSGKSTLINLIPRFFDVNEGEILVDGVNVKEYKLDALNKKIGYVSQKAIMFKGSINSNISYGKEVTEENEDEVKDAAYIAQATEFIDQIENHYESNISQGGTNLSGGQKQRVSIARAIFKKPEIIIFDDSFSALDYKTDRLLRKTLKEKTEGVTTLIVAQRIGTIMDADKIIVLDEGKIVGMGKHKDLLKSCSVYSEIALSQLSKEELA